MDGKEFDAIVVGGGHNGLVCANYLAEAGKKVCVVEARHVLGGAAVSEELYPGHTYSRCSYVLSLLRQNVIKEIFPANWRDELILFKRDPFSFTPHRDGGYLLLSKDSKVTRNEISKFSKKDVNSYEEFEHKWSEICNLVGPFFDRSSTEKIFELVT